MFGVKSAKRDERLSGLALTGVEKFMVGPSSYTQDGYHSLSSMQLHTATCSYTCGLFKCFLAFDI